MSVVMLQRVTPEPPKPRADIIQLLRDLLAAAEAGDMQDIAVVWTEGNEISDHAITTDELALGAIAYAMAHRLMTGENS